MCTSLFTNSLVEKLLDASSFYYYEKICKCKVQIFVWIINLKSWVNALKVLAADHMIKIFNSELMISKLLYSFAFLLEMNEISSQLLSQQDFVLSDIRILVTVIARVYLIFVFKFS